jgi:undecaprenyl-diphosphatase
MSLLNLLLTFTQLALETLPVSSSAHVLIVKKLYSAITTGPAIFAEHFYQLCNIPTLLVLIFYFRRDLAARIPTKQQIFGLAQENNPFRKTLQLIGDAFVACSITVIFYFLSKNMPPYEQFMPAHPVLIALAMSCTALMLFSLKFIKDPSNYVGYQMNLGNAIVLGLVQTISLTPGISRFAATYVACRWLGNNGNFSLRYSFFLHSILTSGLLIRSIFFRWEKTVNVIAEHFSLAMVPTILLGTLVSVFLLKLADTASRNNKMWAFSFYLPIPIVVTLLLWILA